MRSRRSPSIGQRFITALIWILSPFMKLTNVLKGLLNRLPALDRDGAQVNLRRLMSDVEGDCRPLFDQFGGQILHNLSSGEPCFDQAIVIVEIRSLRLRAVRDRGRTAWEIMGPASGSRWQSLGLVCEKIVPREGPFYSDFQVLRDHLPEFEALSASDFGLARRRP